MSHAIEINLRQQRDYRFAIEFGAGVPTLYGDEAPPLGAGSGPTPVQLLAAAVGNCLSDSLYFALRKFKQDPQGVATKVSATIERNTEGRMRVTRMRVTVKLGALAATIHNLDRVLAQFEGFCTVAQSVGQGIPIEVSVFDGADVQVE